MLTLEQLQAELASLNTQRQWAIQNKRDDLKVSVDGQIEQVESQIEDLKAAQAAEAKAKADAKAAADKAAAEAKAKAEAEAKAKAAAQK